MQYSSSSRFENREKKSDIASLGKLLRQERLNKGWSKEIVARNLNLSVTQISALEKDEYGALGESVYIRGYWRNYSRLLGVFDMTESMMAYKQNLNEAAQNISVRAGYYRAYRLQEKSRNKGAVVCSFVVLLFLIGLWLLENRDSPSNPQSSSHVSTNKIIALDSEQRNNLFSVAQQRKVGSDEPERYDRGTLPQPSFFEKDSGSL